MSDHTANTPQQLPNDILGETLGGRYLVQALLGEGTMGQVYQAHREDMGQRVALKVLHAHHTARRDFVGRFQREIRSTARLSHPNVISVYDSGVMPDGRAFYVMEFVDGVPLRKILDDEVKLPVSRALHIIRQIAAAVGAAHTKGIVHRDVKPANIMISQRAGQDDYVTVLDFGLAKATAGDEDLTSMGTLVGTPEYMAPEVAARTATTPAGDVYAMGCMLFEMLSGAPPYRRASTMGTVIAHLSEPLPEWPTGTGNVPQPLRELVARMLAKDPLDRPANGSAVLGSLDVVEAELAEAGLHRPRRVTGRNRSVTSPTRVLPVATPPSALQPRTPRPTVSQQVARAMTPSSNPALRSDPALRGRRETPHKQASHPRLQDFAARTAKGDRVEAAPEPVRRVTPAARPHAPRPIAKGHVQRADGRKSIMLVRTAGPAGITATVLGYGPDLVVGAVVDIELPGPRGTFPIASRIAKAKLDGARGPTLVALELNRDDPGFALYAAAATKWTG